jgi:hypothetical protein
MMAQVLDVSVTCGHPMETRESSRVGRPVKPFFILRVCGPHRATGHVVMSEPSRAGMQGPVPWDTWQRWSPLEKGGKIQSHGIRGSTGTLSSREAGSGAVGHMAVSEPSQAGKQDPML